MFVFSFIALFLSLKLPAASNEIFNVQFIQDMQNHFSAKWIIFYSCSKIDSSFHIMEIVKKFKNNPGVFINVYDHKSLISYFNLKLYKLSFVQPMVLFSCNDDCLLKLNDFNNYHVISKFIWIASWENDTIREMPYLRHDSQFFYAEKFYDSIFLQEIYQTFENSPYYYNLVGEWNAEKGLKFSDVSFEERRSDLFQQNVFTYLVPPARSLEYKEPFFYIEAFISIANRLNIRLNRTTKLTDDYKLSAGIAIMTSRPEISKDLFYFYPLQLTKIILFYKNLKSEMLLDSFIKPFDFTVWLTIFVYIFIMALFSYIISKSLNFRSSLHFYQELLDSVFILLQKGDNSNEKFVSQKIIKLSQWISAIMLYSLYSALFIAYVTIVIRKAPFNDINGFLQDGRYNVVVHEQPITAGYSGSHPDPRIKRLFQRHYYPPLNKVYQLRDAVKMMCYSKTKYVVVHAYIHYQTMKERFSDCPISDTYITIQEVNMAWSIRKEHSPYERIFNYFLLKLLQSGSIINLYEERTKAHNAPELSLFDPIELEQTIFLFMCLSLGLIISSVFFVLELHFYKLSKKYNSLKF